jgi:hypothetical protein
LALLVLGVFELDFVNAWLFGCFLVFGCEAFCNVFFCCFSAMLEFADLMVVVFLHV